MLDLFNVIGLLAFSFSGAVKGLARKLDLFGISVLGLMTALGGGAVRDLMVREMPRMLTDPSYIGFSLVGVLLTLLLRRHAVEILHDWPFTVSDALGLAAFTAAGCLVARAHGLGGIGMAVLGLSTAIGGGLIRDILVSEIPLILRKEFYATCSLIGILFFWGLNGVGLPPLISSSVCMAVVFCARFAALRYHWHLPHFS